MCGIVGFIGKPKDREACFALTTALLAKTQVRGDDASGFWATNTANGDNGLAIFSKAAKKSTEFIKTDPWLELKNRDLNLLISHCRRSSSKGSENKNRNNHPFFSKSYRTALVHNGNVPEFDVLRGKYDIATECDSEILLRIMELGIRYPLDFLRQQLKKVKTIDGDLIKDLKDEDVPLWSHKVLGLADIFARINYGAMAVAIAERWEDDTRALWLFRDKDRPLQVVDMRETLGQVYVVSEKRIFREAVEATPSVRKYVKGNTPILEFPPMYIWVLMLTTDNEISVKKMHVNRHRKYNTTFEQERPPLEDAKDAKPIRVITNLDFANHEVKTKTVKKPTNTPIKPPSHITNPKPKSNKIPVQTGGTNPTTVPPMCAPDQISDWPDDCYEYLHRYITFSTTAKGSSHPTVPGSPKDLKTAAEKTNLPNPSWTAQVSKDQRVAAKIVNKNDYIKWAQYLQQEFKWMPRYRGDNMVTLSSLLKEAHESWVTHIQNTAGEEKPKTKIMDIASFPRDCFEFIHKCILTMSEPSGASVDPKRVEYGPVSDIEQSSLAAGVPDPSITTAELQDDDYKDWADILQDEYGWCDRATKGKLVSMEQMLKDFHETWLAFIDTTTSDPKNKVVIEIDDDEEGEGDEDGDRTTAVNSHINNLTPPFDSDPATIRIDTMAIEKKMIDAADLDKFNEILVNVRANLDDLDVMVADLFREGTLQKEEFDGLLSNLEDVSGLLQTDKFMIENIRRTPA